jgi:RHS repeat-associated protein
VSAKRYRYTGKERDEETSLYYHGARYYAPWLGRWTAADPLGIAEPGRPDLNLYAYVSGRATLLLDPTGLDGEPKRKEAQPKSKEKSAYHASPKEFKKIVGDVAQFLEELGVPSGVIAKAKKDADEGKLTFKSEDKLDRGIGGEYSHGPNAELFLPQVTWDQLKQFTQFGYTVTDGDRFYIVEAVGMLAHEATHHAEYDLEKSDVEAARREVSALMFLPKGERPVFLNKKWEVFGGLAPLEMGSYYFGEALAEGYQKVVKLNLNAALKERWGLGGGSTLAESKQVAKDSLELNGMEGIRMMDEYDGENRLMVQYRAKSLDLTVEIKRLIGKLMEM